VLLPQDAQLWLDAAAVAAYAGALALPCTTAEDLPSALQAAVKINGPAATILICGSLYLAGDVLAQNGTLPV
jgi:dihydrofolate synthase / folylpolyglutamate synthase